MASVGEGDCHKDPNFAVVCSFLDKYGASLGLEPTSYYDLQKYLEDTTGDVSRVLIDIHVRLLRRIGKSIVNSDRFEKSIIKFCHNFSEFDAWEVESYGYKHAQLGTKLRILKNLLECQFDYNLKFKEKINGESAEEMRLLPVGRDKEGQAYWYFLDHDMNLLLYKEEQDDEVADTWKLVCSSRNELADLVSSLQKGGKEEEDKSSTCESRSSKEGSPDKDATADKKVAQELVVQVKEEKVDKQEIGTKGKQIVKEEEGTVIGVKKKEVAQGHFEIVKKEVGHEEMGVAKEGVAAQELVVDSIKVKRINKKPAESVKKEKTAREPVAKKGKTVEIHLVDFVKEKKSAQEGMGAASEKVPKEKVVDVVKDKKLDQEGMDADSEKVPKEKVVDVVKDKRPAEEGMDADSEQVPKEQLVDAVKDKRPAEEGMDADSEQVPKEQLVDVVKDKRPAEEGMDDDSEQVYKEQLVDIVKDKRPAEEGMDADSEQVPKEQLVDVVKDQKPDQEGMDADSEQMPKEQLVNVVKDKKPVHEGMDADNEQVPKKQLVDVVKDKKPDQEGMDADSEQVPKKQLVDVVKDKKPAEEGMDADGEQVPKEQLVDVVKDKKPAEEGMDADGEQVPKEQLVDVVKDKKPAHEGMDADSEQVPKEQLMDVVKDNKLTEEGMDADSEQVTKEQLVDDVKDKKSAHEGMDADSEQVTKEQLVDDVKDKKPAHEGMDADNEQVPKEQLVDVVKDKKPAEEGMDADSEQVTKEQLMDDVKDKKSDHEGMDADSEQVPKEQLVDVVKDKKSDQEGMDADSEQVPKEQTVTILEKEHTVHVVEASNEDLSNKNSDKSTTNVETEKEKPISKLNSGKERIASEAQSKGHKSDDTNIATTNKCQDSEKKSDHCSDLKSNNNVLSYGKKSAELENTVLGHDDEEEPEDNAGGDDETSESRDTLQTVKSPGLETSLLSEKTSLCEKSPAQLLCGTCSEEEQIIEIQEKNPLVTEQEQVKGELTSEVSANQTEDAKSGVDVKQAEVTSRGEANQENIKVTEVNLEGSSDDTLKERPCSSGENNDTEKVIAVASEQLDVPSADKISDSGGGCVTESSSTADESASCTLASSSVEPEAAIENIQTMEKKLRSEQKDQQADSETLTVENESELSDVAVDLSTTAKKVLPNTPPSAQAADNDTVNVHPVSCDKSVGSADLNCSDDLLHKESGDVEQNKPSPLQLTPEPPCHHDQVDPKSCQDCGSSSVHEKSVTEITSESLTSGVSLNSPECSSADADNQGEKSQKLDESHSSQNTESAHTDPEEAQNTNVNESDVNKPVCESVDQPESSVEIKSHKELEQDNSAVNTLDSVVEKELTETPCEKSVIIENNKADSCANEDSEKKQETVDTKTVKNIKVSRRKRKVGKVSKKNTQMVNGHTDNSDLPFNKSSEKSVDEKTNKDCVKCDDSSVDDSISQRTKRKIVNQVGKPTHKNKMSAVSDNTSTKCANSVLDDASVNSENCVTNTTATIAESEVLTNSESSMVKDLSTSQTPSRRKLKRSVPEPTSDDPVDSEPNGKRAKQATRTQKTRAGRNAAARGRSARMAPRDSESDDSDTPLSQVRGRGQGLARGAGGRRTRGSACQRQQTQPNQESAQDEEGEDGNGSKLGKKKKPDSSTEALSEDDATPAKKGRNQTQSTTAANSKSSNKRKGCVAKKPSAQTTPAPAAEEDAAGIRRSLRVRQQRARRPPTPSSASEATEETSEDGLSSEEEEEEEDHDKDFLDSSFTPEEDSGDEEFKPKGRNFQRQAARTSKEEAEDIVNDDTPCVKCGKYNHPEMILLCDKCDAGYHTACLRPPLMLIPDGDWFCPPCEHSKLVEKLLECLQSFDLSLKKKDRLNKRQERLAFVGISISNILHGDRKVTQSVRYTSQGKQMSASKEESSDGEVKAEREEPEKHDDSASTSSHESKPGPKRMYRSERLAIRQAQKRSRKEKRRQNQSRQKRSPEVEVLTQRTCRTRAAVSYQFKEFDELINNAIEDDKPFRREKPPGISRGKDMSNILGASDEEDEKIRQRDGESGPPPPVVKKKCRRRLTKLDSDEDPDDDDDESDEFKLSEEEDSDATECEVEEDAEDDESGSSDSGDWQPKKTWYNSHTSSRKSGRRLHNFVVDDEYNSDENATKRRSTRNSNRGRIHYSDWGSDEETEEEARLSDNSSEGSLYAGKKSQKQSATRMKQKGTSGKKQKGGCDSHDSDSSITIRRKNLRRIIKKRRKDESETEDSEKEAKSVKEIQKKKKEGKSDSEESHFVNEGESHEDSDDSPRFKKKNVLRSSDEDETESDVADVKPVMAASEASSTSVCTPKVDTLPAAAVAIEASSTSECIPKVDALPAVAVVTEASSESECTPKVDTLPAAAVVTEAEEATTVKTKSDTITKTKPDIITKIKPDTITKIKPDTIIKIKPNTAGNTKPRAAAKGKKRSDWCEEDKVTVSVTDVAVPGKVRKVSTSDREPEGIIEAAPLVPVSEVSAPAGEKKPQVAVAESEVNEEVQDVGMCPVDKKAAVSETGDSNPEPSPVKEKTTGSGKKRTVPNFLDVNSGEESDEQNKEQAKDSVVSSSFIADGANVQSAAPSQTPSDSAKARADHLEGHQHHRNFPHAGQHYPFGVGPYNNSVQGGSSYTHRQVTGSPQNVGQIGRETGPPPQNANMLNPAAHNGPPGLIRGFPDSMPRQSGTEAGSAAAHGVRAPHSYAARGPRPNLGHPFPPGIRHSSQGMEPGQSASKLNQEHRMSHPGFQGIPVGHYPPAGPAGGHMRPGQAQQHRGMQPPFYMGQQQHARPGMENDNNSSMGSYIAQSYGARRMPSAHFGQDLSASAVRNPYYGMQTSPPHNMGQHFPRQYPGGMGPGPHNMSSPLTSMGQMARNLGAGAGSDMHSPPNTQAVGSGEGSLERRSSLGSPPNQESIHRQEKLVEIKDIKTESNEEDLSGKKLGKTGKKRAVASKSKKKSSEPNAATQDIGQPLQQGPAPATSHGQMTVPSEGQERVSGPGQVIGSYRVNSQPYHMPPYQMPYPHGSNVNPLQMTQGPYMNPRHTPPATAHQRSKADGNSASLKNGEGKWSRTETTEAQCSSMANKSPVHMSSYHQHFQKSQPNEQTVSSLERRHSLSPGSQISDVPPADRMKEPALVKQMSMRKQGTVDVKPNIQGLPTPTTHTTETSPDFGGSPAVPGQTGAPSSQDHSMHASAHSRNIPQYSHAGGVNTSETPRAYYNSASYYSRGPDPRQPMSQNSTWNADIQGHGLRYGPPIYPYSMNPTNAGHRMPVIKSEYGTHGHSNSDLSGVPEKGSSTQDSSTNDDPVKVGKISEQQGPVLQRSSSSEFQMVKVTESGQTYQKNVELDIKPIIRHTDTGPEGAEKVSLSEPQRPQPSLSESVSSLSTTSTSPSVQSKLAPHLSEVTTTAASMCKQSPSAEPSSFHHSTSSGMNQSHQVSPVATMAPHSSWPRTNSSVQYPHQHMSQWANMGGPPAHYNMNRPYGGPPGVMPHPAYGMDPQSPSIRPSPGQVDQKPFMHQNYESRFQPPYPGVRPAGPETEYHRAGFNPDYSPSGRYPPQLQNCPRRPDGSSHLASHTSDVADQGTELNTVSKPKRAKTQKKTGKDPAVGPVRGKSSKGTRGRGRGGFMIDNLLQARGVEADEGEDSSEMNDIVSYVTTDEYFKQQTSCDSFKHKTDIGVTEKKL